MIVRSARDNVAPGDVMVAALSTALTKVGAAYELAAKLGVNVENVRRAARGDSITRELWLRMAPQLGVRL